MPPALSLCTAVPATRAMLALRGIHGCLCKVSTHRAGSRHTEQGLDTQSRVSIHRAGSRHTDRVDDEVVTVADPTDYVQLVQRAQDADQAAFGALVAQFQDLALGTAFVWLRD